jgi:tetratricopeptide (TPR) repeat protein
MLQKNPAYAQALRLAAQLMMDTQGDFTEGLRLSVAAIESDPLDSANYGMRGLIQYRHGDLAEARSPFRNAIEINPSSVYRQYALGSVLLAQSEPTAALAEMEREQDAYRQVGLPLALDRLGRKSEADAALVLAEEKSGLQAAYQIAVVYAARNDADRAFTWLERAYRQHDVGLIAIKVDLLLKNLEPDPRYKAFLRKINLPE